MANSNRKLGGGSGSRVNKEVGNRLGNRSDITNVRAISQIGQTLGNHVTETRKTTDPREKTYTGRLPAGGPGGVPLGNETAARCAAGPGGGREVMKSGSQCQMGPVAGTAWSQGREIDERPNLNKPR
jgi:hypothetical protein